MLLTDTFLSRVEAFLDESKKTATAFGKEAAGDPNFVFDLRNGRSPSLKLAQRVLDYIEVSSADQAREAAQ